MSERWVEGAGSNRHGEDVSTSRPSRSRASGLRGIYEEEEEARRFERDRGGGGLKLSHIKALHEK